MVVFMLEKDFAANKSYKTREKSEKLKLPKGTIIQVAAKGETGCADQIRWWLEVDGSPLFPFEHTENHWGLRSKPDLSHIIDRYEIKRHGVEVQLIGFNEHGTTAYWMQVFLTVVPDK